MRVAVAVGVRVGVGVIVRVVVAVAVPVAVTVGARVALAVAVGVAVGGGASVAVAVGVFVAVSVAVGVAVLVGVAVGASLQIYSTCAALADTNDKTPAGHWIMPVSPTARIRMCEAAAAMSKSDASATSARRLGVVIQFYSHRNRRDFVNVVPAPAHDTPINDKLAAAFAIVIDKRAALNHHAIQLARLLFAATGLHCRSYARVKIVPGLALLNFAVNVSPTPSVTAEP